MLLLRRLIPLALAVGLTSGCVAPGMGGLTMNATISGGQTVPINFDSHGVIHAENDDFYIKSATLILDVKQKKVGYFFQFKEKHKQELREVKVEDVTDDTAVTWIDDHHPAVDAHGEWSGKVPLFDPTQASASWLFELENSVRIYRFTITTGGGQTEILYEGANYPAQIKKYFRVSLGLEKVDKP